ncbi:ABC transporter ATP-binding protein [Aliiroseovarius crassostreae]|uniref:ATP-binding cassette domain-containing protein n=1 Tax=Aliiroseovarius crassostreae TaxID=154981 RepID=UPI0021FFCE48|nr:ABC transporter ATP-binding protein [Aliiroseovarius crassostreae]UWP88305.1 ABC transporter ATP-binding protein [Aliiroseovarius crassostreae]UWP91463.1 ABC transporter ATP-binding protein [Aliiroseovarius crassostreae]
MVEILSVKELSVVNRAGQVLLDNVGFSLNRGQRMGLVGASGCGKSLTAAVLCGLLRPPLSVAAGQVRIDGQDVLGLSASAWRRMRGRRIFQIFQSPGTALTPGRRIRSQLAEAARLAGDNEQASVNRALDAVALPQRVTDCFPYQLSGGMKQRVLIAMALILRPRILIADEPTTGLDVLTEREVLGALNTMADETGATLLFISHDLRAVQAVAERTLVMQQGRLVEDARIDQLAVSGVAAARDLAGAAAALQGQC